MAESAGRRIATINESLGVEASPSPEGPTVYLIRGMVLAEEELLDQAIEQLNKALVIDPNMVKTRGWARRAKRDFDGATSYFNKYVELASKEQR